MAKKNKNDGSDQTVENYEFEPIKGYPMLNWKGKRPFTSTQYYPAQLKESYGKPAADGWMNRIYWGDNLQVMSHLLKEFRGKVNLIYIDPPFDSKADYKKKITLKGQQVKGDATAFEEKQYSDLWINDEYFQFMYERITLMRELLANNGSLYIHCDYHVNSHLRLICDEILGAENLINQITWKRTGAHNDPGRYGVISDTILFYSKSSERTWNQPYAERSQESLDNSFNYAEKPDGSWVRLKKGETIPKGWRRFQSVTLRSPNPRPNLVYEYKGYKPHSNGWSVNRERMERYDRENRLIYPEERDGAIRLKMYLDESPGIPVQDFWADIGKVEAISNENLSYPTQKPEALLERIIKTSSNEGDIVFDCFVGSGTTLAVASKLQRKFIGADINLGAVQTTTQRLTHLLKDFGGFQVFNVNRYDVFRNPIEAKSLLASALEIEQIKSSIFDGEKDGRMVKIMPSDRISSKADLADLIAGFDYKAFEKRKRAAPNQPVEKILLVCMGHEADLAAHLKKEVPYLIDVQIVDVLRDKQDLQFKRESEARIKIKGKKLIIDRFYPMNLLQKLSLQKEKVTDWRELVESVLIDWNYDGAVLEPTVIDIPDKDELVKGEYEVPQDAGTIRVKITDLLSESLEVEVERE